MVDLHPSVPGHRPVEHPRDEPAAKAAPKAPAKSAKVAAKPAATVLLFMAGLSACAIWGQALPMESIADAVARLLFDGLAPRTFDETDA